MHHSDWQNAFLLRAKETGRWYLMPVILATQETEIRRIEVQSQSRQIVMRHYLKKKKKNRAGGVAPGEGPEFKPHTAKKKKKRLNNIA
jgi:hypothetical protein